MLSLALVTLAAAALCWPAGAGRGRLIQLGRRRARAQVVATGPDSVTQRCPLLGALAAGLGAPSQCLQSCWHFGRGVRVQGSGTSLVPGIECGEQFAYLRPAHLPDHEAVRAHPQRLAHQIAQRHLTSALDVGRPGGQPDHMRVPWLQLGGFLHAHNPLASRHAAEQRSEQCGLIKAVPSLPAWVRSGSRSSSSGTRRVDLSKDAVLHDQWEEAVAVAVDQDGNVLDVLLTSRCDAKAATRFFRTLLVGLRSVPRVLITDKLVSYGVAHCRLMPSVEHRRSKYLDDRAGNSHQPCGCLILGHCADLE